MNFWYLATPFTRYPEGRHAAWTMACQNTGLLLAAGVKVFSPIVHTYHLEHHAALADRDHAFWMAVDEPMMHAAYGLLVVRAKGWEASKGVTQEIAFFEENDKPIGFMDPGVVPGWLVRHEAA